MQFAYVFPRLETISPYLFGDIDFDLRDPEVKRSVRELIFTDIDFAFQALLNLTDYVPEHKRWLEFERTYPQTLLLAPRGSLKCVSPDTVVATPQGPLFAVSLTSGQVYSYLKEHVSRIIASGITKTAELSVVSLPPPFDFFICCSPEHVFPVFNLASGKIEEISAKFLVPGLHCLLVRTQWDFPRCQTQSACEYNPQDPFLWQALDLEADDFQLFCREFYTHIKDPFRRNQLDSLRLFKGCVSQDAIADLKKQVLSRFKQIHVHTPSDVDELTWCLGLPSRFRTALDCTIESDFCFVPVKEVTPMYNPYPLMVDFETTSGFYTANGVVTHNSTVTTVLGSLLAALENPDVRIAIISFNSKLSTKCVQRIRSICERNPVIRYVFGDIINPREIRLWSSEALEFCRRTLLPEPTIWALSVGTDFTGLHFDVIHFDDLVTLAHRFSPAVRARTWDWFRMTALPAIEATGVAHVKGTRYHWDDLYGRLYTLFEKTGSWQIMRTPAADEELYSQGIIKSFWPSKWSDEDLLSIRNNIEEDAFLLQYQVLAGKIIDEDIRDLNERISQAMLDDDELEYCKDFVLAVDLAAASTSVRGPRKSSFAIVVVARHSKLNKVVVVDTFKRQRVPFEDQRRWVISKAQEYNVGWVVIEHFAYQSVFSEYVASHPDWVYPIRAFKDTESKDFKFDSLVMTIANGRLAFLRSKVDPLIQEIFSYPETTADLIDSTYNAIRSLPRHEPNIHFIGRGEFDDEEE